MPIKLPINSTMKESKVSIEELKELVEDYRGKSPFESKCVWISKELLDELASRNDGHAGFRIYFAGFEWEDKDPKKPKDDGYEKMQKVQIRSQNAGPKKYQSLIFVSTDKDQEDLLDAKNCVIVGEKIEPEKGVETIQSLRICPPPPPNDCKGRLI
ncbi:MAG: hypothetical protein ACXWV4_07785 [Flavitalea sp.]